MRDFEFIHATEDVREVLQFANDLGLVIRDDQPTATPEPKIISAEQVEELSAGVYMLYRPEWVFGEFVFEVIPDGYNAGKYFQHPSTNYVSVNLYFGGERLDGSVRRLGGGNLSRRLNWYRPCDHTIHDAPPDVKAVFDTIRKHIDTRKRLRGGVHRYTVLREAWQKLADGSAVPPFPYIEWPPVEK